LNAKKIGNEVSKPVRGKEGEMATHVNHVKMERKGKWGGTPRNKK